MNEQAKALAGTLAAYKSMADGTLRVTIDFDEKFSREFHQLFPAVHGFVAVAPLAAAEEAVNE